MIINDKNIKTKIAYKGPKVWVKEYINKLISKRDKENSKIIKEHNQNYLQQVNIDREASSKIKDIFSPLLGIVDIDIYVHGSWADNTKTAFSDLDDLIIIDQKQYDVTQLKLLKEKLKKVDRTFQKLDPLQHHGHWIISKSSLEDYDASFMPLFILEDAVLVKGNKEIVYKKNTEKTREGLKRNIITTKNNIERFYEQFQGNSMNIYTLKEFIGSVLLIPPMIFQYSGTEIDKRKAINNSPELFSPNAIACIKWASNCRSEWSKITDSSSYTFFKYMLNLVTHPKYARKVAKKFSPALPAHLHKKWELKQSAVENYLAEIETYL